MADGSLPSLDVSDFAEKLLKEKEQLSGNVLDLGGFGEKLLQEEIGRVSAAARWAKDFDPESYAKVQKLAPGLPPDVAARQQPSIEQMAKVKAYNEVFGKAPAIRQHFARYPKDLPTANPDELDKLSGINWVLGAFGASLGAGQEQSEMFTLGSKFVAGAASPAEIKKLQEFGAQPGRTFGAGDGWFSGALTLSGQTIPMIAQSIIGGAGGAAAGASAGAMAGALGGPFAAIPGALTGASIGGIYGSTMEAMKLQQGQLAVELLGFRDEAGNPLDPNIVRWAAFLGGTAGGVLEQLGYTKALGLVPGLDKIFTSQGIKTVLKNPMMREAFGRFVKNLGEAVTVETLTEVGQEGFAILAGEIAKETSGQDFQMLTSQEAAQRMTDAGVQALQVMTLLGPITSGTRFAADLKLMRDSKRSQDNLKKIGEALDGNGLLERAPQVAAPLIDTMAGGQKVYIPAEEMRTLYQEQGLDVYGPAIPNWRQRFDEALATAGDVEVSMGEFFTALGTDPQANPMYTLARADPSHYIGDEMRIFSEGMEDLLGSELQKAEGRISRKLDDSVKKAVAEQISQLGFTPEATNAYATVLGAYFNTRAAQIEKEQGTKVNPVDLFQQNLALAREDLSNTIENGNSMVPSLRRLLQSAYHGSRAIFDRFSTDFMGTGEGAQAFGWGLYFAQDKELGQLYRKKLSRDIRQLYVDGELMPASEGTISYLAGDTFKNADTAGKLEFIDQGIKQLERYIDINNEIVNEVSEGKSDGSSIGLTPEEYIDSLEVESQRYLNEIAESQAIRALVEQGKDIQSIFGPALRTTKGLSAVDTKAIIKLVDKIDGLVGEEQTAVVSGLSKLARGGSLEEATKLVRDELIATAEIRKRYDLEYESNVERINHVTGIFLALEPVVQQAGRLYEVNLPDDDQLLLWDRPLSEQDPKVREALAGLGFSGAPTAEEIATVRGTEDPITFAEILANRNYPSSIQDWNVVNLDQQLADQGFSTDEMPPETTVYRYDLNPDSFIAAPRWSLGEPAADETIIEWASEDRADLSATGEEIYQQLKERFSARSNMPDSFDATLTRSDQRASLALKEAGILGHKFLDGNSRSAGDGTYNFVIYTDEAIEIKRFEQRPEGEDARGAITFQKDRPALIQLFEKADMSTLLHESAHFFLETTKEWASQSPEIDAQWQVIKKHLKVGDDNVLTREQHEQFAKWGEAYFMEGKAPNAELRSAFAAFRQWLKALYKSITNLGGSVHPEIRAVFDSMLTTDDRFDAISNDTAYAPLFKDAAEMGVDPEDYLEYQRWVQAWRDEASDKTIGRVIGQQKRLISGHYKKIQANLVKTSLEKLRQLPPYSHAEKFKTPGFAMDTEAFAKKYGRETAAKFPRTAFNKTGLDPEVVAELLGYPTADEMVYDFRQAAPIKDAAKEMAEAEMVRRYGDDFQQQAILDLAVKRALAEDARVTILAKEYQVLSRKAGREVTQTAPRQLAQEIARKTVWRKKVKDVNERQAQAANRRAGVMAEAAMRKGDWVAAADWKRKQLLAQAIDNETQVLNRTLNKIRDKAAKYSKTAPKSIDPGAMEQIRALVSQYHFAKVPLRQIAKTERLREWMAKQEAEGLVPDIPDHLLRRAEKLNWKELSVEELLGLGDTLDNLEHVGRLKLKLRTAKGLREFAGVKGEIRKGIAAARALNPKKPREMKTYTEEERKWYDSLNGFHYHFLKPEQIIEFLDAEQVGGPLANAVFEPMAQSQNVKNDLNFQYNAKLVEIFQKFESERLLEVVEIKSLKTKMTRENLIAVALNTGNTSNREKMLQGEIWKEEQLQEMLSYLSEQDWDRVQEIWNLLNELWEKTSALERKLTGVAPPKIESKEFERFGKTYAGGYYPVVYDFTARRGLGLIQDITPQDKKGDIESELFPKNFTPGTNHKHLVARQKVAKPFRLDLHVLPGHIHNVIHDLAYREAIRSAYKVLWDPDISNDIAEAESPQAVRELRNWLRAVATEHAVENDPSMQMFTRLRVGATMVGMGFRVSTAISQLLGFLPALTRVGTRRMSHAVVQVLTNRQETLEMVNGLSGELRHRFNNQDREIRESVRSLVEKQTTLDRIRAAAFVHIGFMDQIISTATWLAAYQEQLEKNPKDQQLAIQNGDRVVRLTQGTGTVKDFAGIMNSGGFLRLFTMFYSFFSAQYAMQSRLTRQSIRDIREGNWEDFFLQKLPAWGALVVLPAVLGALITGQGPEDDENPWAWAARKTLTYPFAAVPFARDIAGSVSGYTYRLSPVAKVGEQAGRALYNLIPDERRDWQPEKALQPSAALAAILFRLPVDQALTSTEALWKGVAEDDLTLGDLLYGRREE